jgi:hypothetical protein
MRICLLLKFLLGEAGMNHQVKRSFAPTMTKFSEQILIRYYALQRRADQRNAGLPLI